MSKGHVFLIGAASFLAGVVVGFLVSPVKNGIGNNSGNNTHYHYGEKNYQAAEPEQGCCCDSEAVEDVLSEENEGVTSGAAETVCF